jgi:hypothetical protein
VLYKANAAASATAGAAPAGEPPAAEQKKDEGVIDAEYVDVEISGVHSTSPVPKGEGPGAPSFWIKIAV